MRFSPVSTWAIILVEVAATRHPTLDVNHVCVLGAEVTCAALQQAVGQSKPLQDGLYCANHVGVVSPFFVCIGAANDNLLNLVELVDAV